MKRARLVVALVALFVALASPAAFAAAPQTVDLKIDGVGTVSAPLQIVLLLTLLSFVPAVLVIMTSFTRIVIVFHFLRQALGTQEMPSNQMLVGLTLFLTAFIMAPVADRINDAAPCSRRSPGQIDVSAGARSRRAAAARVHAASRRAQTDLALFVELGADAAADDARPTCRCASSFPAYAISELKTGFQMGFFLFVPFLLIDLVVSTTLLSMGMMQLPPAMISLPFKVLLFVMIDGWNLLVGSIVRSFV